LSKRPDYLSSELISHYRYIGYTRKKMEHLYSKGEIVRRDIEFVYSGLFLDMFTTFERFIERLFIELLIENKLTVSPSYTSQKILFKSINTARKVVFGGKNYVDWFPYRLTEERAEAFFHLGKPFSPINKDTDRIQAKIKNKQDKKTIENVMIIRNAIAHNSVYAIKRFDQELIAGATLPPRERTPSGFLRSKYRISPPQTRFEYFSLEISSIAIKLCSQ